MWRVLLIEDEEAVRSTCAQRLELEGYEVRTAVNGREGLALAQQFHPDIILCDILMPDLDGYSVVSQLRGDPAVSHIPVIFLTALSGPDRVRQGMNLGADDYLTKPYSITDLLAAIESRLRRSAALRANTSSQLDAVSEALGSLMHELRGPLCAAVGYAETLPSLAPATPADASSESLRLVKAAVPTLRRLVNVTEEVLTYARSRLDQLPFRPETLDLAPLAAEVVAAFPDARRVSIDAPDSGTSLVADRRMCRYIVRNLVDNALKYSRADSPVQLRLSTDSRAATLEVLDHGIGLPESERSLVFLPFYRASNAGSTPGTGLGLALVQHCVARHGGRIEIASGTADGTCVRVRLPLTPPAFSPSSAPQHLQPPDPARTALQLDGAPPSLQRRNPPARVLIVDDELLAREHLRAQLTDAPDFTVVGEASSLAAARAALADGRIDVVFLDIRLPDGLGFELLSEVPPAARVVFTSAFDEYTLAAFPYRPISFLTKPIDPAELARTLDLLRALPQSAVGAEAARVCYAQQTLVLPYRTGAKALKLPQVELLLADGEYSVIHAVGGEHFMVRKALDAWQSELPYPYFVRAHRGAIINVTHIDKTARLPNRRLSISLRGFPSPIVASARMSPQVKKAVRNYARLSARA